MSKKRYIYVIEAYAYSDYEKIILTHKKDYSKEEFLKIVKEAQKNICDNFYDYSTNLVRTLIKKYGFEHFDYPCVYVGDSRESKITLVD